MCFCEDITATAAARIAGVNRNTANSYYQRTHELIFEESLKEFGEFECDKSYFGARRVRGKRGRGAAGKTPVFGLLKRGERVYVKVVENCSRESLMPVIQELTLEGSTIYTDGRKAYDGLILNGYEHYRVFHHENEFARGKSHVNGIENFWSFAKGRLAKFHGCASGKFALHLKECVLATQLRAVAVQPQARELAASGQEVVQVLRNFLKDASQAPNTLKF